MSDIVKVGGTELQTTEEPNSMLAVIARAAADPRVDVTKMAALLDMQFKIESRNAEVEFNAALARLMPRLPRIQKNGTIFNKDGKSIRSRYAFYEDIDAAIRPLLAEEGLAFSFETDDSHQGQLRVTGILSHQMGFNRKSSFTVPTSNPVISGGQAVGAANSLARRYIVCNMLNLITVGEDNDGQGAREPITDAQVLELEQLLADTNSDVVRFKAWAQVDKLSEILQVNFDACLSAIRAKGRK